jgi:hypothetical protein
MSMFLCFESENYLIYSKTSFNNTDLSLTAESKQWK